MIHPLTPARWPDLEALFETASATRNCWCMWWRIAGNAWRDTNKASRKADMHRIAHSDRPAGLIAYDGDKPVGWVQITPRLDVPRFNNGRVAKPAKAADLAADWAMTCFFIAASHRGQGLMEKLSRAGCRFAVSHGASTVDASAHMPDGPLKFSDGYTGLVPALLKAGFRETDRKQGKRVLMRWTSSTT
ncbi:MAG: GNAT family N-acetyltransferase [Pseudomonadota bacterium]